MAANDESPIAASSDTERRLSAFEEKLPLEIRRQIYGELLKSENVRQPPDAYLVQQYKFDTRILGVNKHIYQEASQVLYHENQFIVVSCNLNLITDLMVKYQVAALALSKPKSVGKFKEHVLRIHMNLPRDGEMNMPRGRDQGKSVKESKAKVACCFILVASELAGFVRALRIFKAARGLSCHRLTFRVELRHGSPPPLAVQKLVLKPFRSLKLDEGFSLNGAIDTAYAQSLKKSMEPTVVWERGRAWEIYDLMQSMADMADQTFRFGSFLLAYDKYIRIQEFFFEDVLRTHPSLMRRIEDAELYTQSCQQLCLTTLVNANLATLRCKCWNDLIKGMKVALAGSTLRAMTGPNQSLMFHCCAIALAANQHDKEALLGLARAKAMDPDNDVAKYHYGITENRIADPTMSEIIYSDEEIQKLCLSSVPPPLMAPSASIATERYLLRHFGYEGDLLDAIKEAAPADMKKAARLIRSVGNERSPEDRLYVGGPEGLLS